MPVAINEIEEKAHPQSGGIALRTEVDMINIYGRSFTEDRNTNRAI